MQEIYKLVCCDTSYPGNCTLKVLCRLMYQRRANKNDLRDLLAKITASIETPMNTAGVFNVLHTKLEPILAWAFPITMEDPSTWHPSMYVLQGTLDSFFNGEHYASSAATRACYEANAALAANAANAAKAVMAAKVANAARANVAQRLRLQQLLWCHFEVMVEAKYGAKDKQGLRSLVNSLVNPGPLVI